MSIYDMAMDAQIRLEAAQSADASGYLGAAAANFVKTIDGVSTYLEGVAQFKSRIPISDSPPISTESVSAAIDKFRSELARHGAEALQQDSAGKLLSVAKDQNARAQRWAKARWEGLFAEILPLLADSAPENLVGGSTGRYTVIRLATRLSRLERLDPVNDADEIAAALEVGQSNASWTDRLRELREELAQALQQDRETAAALAPEVQEALAAAASEGGLSLSDLTIELLEDLRTAGVDGDLVVRRR